VTEIVDITALKSDVDTFPGEHKTISPGEIQQVTNIRSSAKTIRRCYF
jgi:hypothetical protein